MPKTVDRNYFRRFYEGKPEPHVIKMFSEGCHVCDELSPEYEKLSNDLKDYTFVKFDVDTDPKLSDLLAPEGVPTIYLYKDGQLAEIDYGEDGYSYEYLKESILNETNFKKESE
jgi:thiol-disulfide isomerase/thioredoxin|tara:strand:+ start:1357 stop:1698 length:342 start_codon:yes stop_codon:yes gene_type:complete